MPIENGTKVFIKETCYVDEVFGVQKGDVGVIVDFDPSDGLYEIDLLDAKTNKAFIIRSQFDIIPEEVAKNICDQVRERAKKSAEELSDRNIVE
jgi:hypothetical protein